MPIGRLHSVGTSRSESLRPEAVGSIRYEWTSACCGDLVRVGTADVVDDYGARPLRANVESECVDGNEPKQETGVRFELPTGVPMEVVTVTDEAYPRSNRSSNARAGHVPSPIDHVQLFTPDVRLFTPDMDGDLEFLRDAIGLHVSDVAGPLDDLGVAFARCNTLHHDVAKRAMPPEGPDHASLHHVARGFDDVAHTKAFLDTVRGRGTEFERRIGRHNAGNNLYAYIWEPGGNRFELCAEMAVVKTDEPNHAEDYETATTAWGPEAPEPFDVGSGLVRPE